MMKISHIVALLAVVGTIILLISLFDLVDLSPKTNGLAIFITMLFYIIFFYMRRESFSFRMNK